MTAATPRLPTTVMADNRPYTVDSGGPTPAGRRMRGAVIAALYGHGKRGGAATLYLREDTGRTYWHLHTGRAFHDRGCVNVTGAEDFTSEVLAEYLIASAAKGAA